MPIGTPNSAAALHHIFYLAVGTQNGGRLKAKTICITSIDLTSTIFQANGLDEQRNQTLKNMVVKYAHEKKKIGTCILTLVYNRSKHTSSLYAPFEVMFGRKAVLPVELTTLSEGNEGLFYN